jgi:hypothetical protein
VRQAQTAVAILDPVQVLDQQITPSRLFTEQGAHLLQRLWFHLPAFRAR